MRPRELERRILAAGLRQLKDRGKGGHRVYWHPEKPGERIVIPWHNREVAKGTERSILSKAGLR